MAAITVLEINKVLASINADYPRPAMEPLSMSELCDNFDLNAYYPHANNPGVYLLFNKSRELLYIGKASCKRDIGKRLRDHFAKDGTAKDPKFLHVKYVATIPVPMDRAFEAAAIEEYLISKLNPSLCILARSEPISVTENILETPFLTTSLP